MVFEPSRRGAGDIGADVLRGCLRGRLDRDLPMMEQIKDQRAPAAASCLEARSYELRYTDLYDAASVLESPGLMKYSVCTLLLALTGLGNNDAAVQQSQLWCPGNLRRQNALIPGTSLGSGPPRRIQLALRFDA